MSPRARVAVVAGALALIHAPGFAQTAKPAAQAITIGQEALALYEGGRFEDALAKFEQAEAIYHSPVFVLYSARSLRRAGRWLEAMATFRRLTRENVDGAPVPWKQAKLDAQRELDVLGAEIPRVAVTVEHGSPATHATLDGVPIAVGRRFEVDPGEHRIVVSDGDRIENRQLLFQPSAAPVDLLISFRAEPEARGKAEPPRVAASTGMYWPGVALATGGIAMGVAGGIVGGFALAASPSAADGLPPSCLGTTCPAGRRDEIESNIAGARRLGTLADVLLVTGGITLVVGLYMTLTHRGARSPTAVRTPVSSALTF